MSELHSKSSFARWSLATTLATYLLITVGALVRASGAGLGCPDWPRCFGKWVPPTSAAELPAGFDPAQFNLVHMWTEYVNRLVGVVIGLLIFGTLVLAWRHHRRDRQIFWPSVAAFVLVGFEGWLGGQVVAHELEAETLTLHLLVALVIVGLLQYAYLCARHAGATRPSSEIARAQRRLGQLALAVSALVFAQVAIGTEVRAVLQGLDKAGVPRAEWLPLGYWPDIAHRQLGVLTTLATAALWWLAPRWAPGHRALRTWASAAAVCCVVQLGLGLGLAYGGVPPVLQLFHLTVASALFGALGVMVFYAYRLPSSGSSHRARS